MPKTLLEKIVFTIVMATIMVYGMIVYNVALNTNGVTNATFAMALHEMPIMVPVACVLEFFVVEKLATALAFTFMKPTDRSQFITYAISLMIVCIMCPVMSLVATLLFKEPSFGTWVHTWGCNMPMALGSEMCIRDRPFSGCCSAAVKRRRPDSAGNRTLSFINRYRQSSVNLTVHHRPLTYTFFIYPLYKSSTKGQF